jgi:gamma-glutamylcyclotransferase (GGCT)/AIG2-like uncharacterized protein YtfP
VAADVETRLAVYGSLAPGKPNAQKLSTLKGHWRKGTVRGHLVAEGWGASLGFPALRLDPEGDAVVVELFESPDLVGQWGILDAFEGSGYRRIATAVNVSGERVSAYIYILAD